MPAIHHTISPMALGGVGAIAASAHLCTARFVEVMRCLQRGELSRARSLWQPLVPLIEAVFAEPNPALIKAALAGQGRIQDGLRLPMTAGSDKATQHLSALLEKLA